jgi:hypothetical protein
LEEEGLSHLDAAVTIRMQEPVEHAFGLTQTGYPEPQQSASLWRYAINAPRRRSALFHQMGFHYPSSFHSSESSIQISEINLLSQADLNQFIAQGVTMAIPLGEEQKNTRFDKALDP